MRYCGLLIALCCTMLNLGWQSPAQDAAAFELERDVAFGKAGARELRLDIARPKGDGPFPVVICLHGGGWVGGERTQMEKTCQVLATRGFVAVTPDYRLAPRDPFPAAIEDCKAAARWLRAHAARLKIDTQRIGVVGFAAGGHLACLLGVTEKEDGLEGDGGNPDETSRVQAVVSFFGPTDLTRTDWSREAKENNLAPFLGGTLAERAELYRKASPLFSVRKGAPPFLLVHGTEDNVVVPAHSLELAEKLNAVGTSVRVLTLEGEGHGLHGEKLRRGLAEMIAFFDTRLKR